MSAAAIAGAQAAQASLPSGQAGNWVKVGIWVLVAIIIIIVIKQGSDIFGGFSHAFHSILQALHLEDSPEAEKANADANAADPLANQVSSPFNPTFYKTAPAGTPLKTQATLSKMADQIYDSVGVIYDDPESGFAAFKQCTNWCMVSQLADKFNQTYGKDVYSWLKIKYDRTSQKDVLAKIVNYSFALPKYS